MTALDTTRCSVIGAGRMGTGIAHALLLSGAHVIVVDTDPERVDQAVRRVHEMVQASARRGVLTEAIEPVQARLSGAVGIEAVQGCGLVVEAVPEIPALKAEILAAVESVLSDDAIIATNTSSISVTQLAQPMRRPERFIGLHFFNPVPASNLIEVVVGAQTAPVTTELAEQLVVAMGKTAIVVNDSPGFASSRLGVALGIEAIRMVQEGVASVEAIDQAMTLGYKHPVGPLRLTDLVGLDVRLGIAEYLATSLGARFEPPQLMRDMVARGELGQKSGQGFYTWPQ